MVKFCWDQLTMHVNTHQLHAIFQSQMSSKAPHAQASASFSFYALEKYMQDICTLLTGSKIQKE